jgi:hypothetical protein
MRPLFHVVNLTTQKTTQKTILVLQFKTREFQFIYLIWATKNLIIYRNPGYCNFGCDKWRSCEVL